MPNWVTEAMVPSNTSPILSDMNSHLSQSVTSRVASSARRSVIEQCSPSSSICSKVYGAHLLGGSTGAPSARSTVLVWRGPRITERMARCTNRSG